MAQVMLFASWRLCKHFADPASPRRDVLVPGAKRMDLGCRGPVTVEMLYDRKLKSSTMWITGLTHKGRGL